MCVFGFEKKRGRIEKTKSKHNISLKFIMHLLYVIPPMDLHYKLKYMTVL